MFAKYNMNMEGIDLDKERQEILRRYKHLVSVFNPKLDREKQKKLRAAFVFAHKAHIDHRRKSGEPYIFHPIAVAQIAVEEIGLGTTSAICALLHDVVEDTETTLEEIQETFGEEVAKIIDGLTKISGIFHQTTSVQAENFRKMLLTLSDDVRVILLKLADRLHNMRTLDALPPKKQLKIANETLYLFAPLAHRLGFHAIKSEMEDLGLKYTEPEIFESISQKLEDTEEERKRFIRKFTAPIKTLLKEEGFNFSLLARTKSISAIWNKMRKKEISFEEVYDLFAIRIIIETPEQQEKADCWKAYSLVTDIYRPNPDRLRDWISTPKANGYESLHTTVMSRTGKWVEVQIRTKRMDEIAEKGYAAHWKYKESKSSESGIDRWLKRIREVLKNSETEAVDFIDDFQLSLFSEEIFVFTPKGELRTLPYGSTALDFAYSIHSAVGNNCLGVKVNNKLMPLNHQLKSGDQIEIITSAKQKPKTDWLGYVKTSRAKHRIKAALRENIKKQADEGKEILERKLKQLKIDNNADTIQRLVDHFRLQAPLDLYYEVALGKIGQKQLKDYQAEKERIGFLSYLRNPFGRSKTQKKEAVIKSGEDIIRKQLKEKPDTLLIGDDQQSLSYTLATCCNPIPGDDVFGFITVSEGIKIHRNNCPNALQMMSKFEYRVVKAKWVTNKDIAFLTGLRISGFDQIGLLQSITNIISSEYNVNIRSINIDTNAGTFEGTVMLYIYDTVHLKNLIEKLKRTKGVKMVSRLGK